MENKEKLSIEFNKDDGTMLINGVEFTKEQTKAVDEFVGLFTTQRLKEFVEYLKSTKKYQAIDEDSDTAGTSWGRRYTLPHHQLDLDLEKFLEERK